jgi:hypothetical protein
VPLALLLSVLVQVVKVPTAHPVATVMGTVRKRKVLLATSGPNTLVVLDEVLLGSRRWVRVHYIILHDNQQRSV